MAVTASFSPTTGVLSVFGDALDNNITISRDAAGNILVNGGAVAILGGSATVANTALIQAFGQGGADTIILDEANGALPAANLFGGEGNDTLIGGAGNDQLFGQSGNDTLLGKGGFDFLFGGADNDTLTGGDADDQVFGESGNDRMIWNPGDDTDLNEGGDGIDTVEVNGGNGAEVFTVTANGTRVRFDRLDPAPFSIDIGTTENLVLNANGGDDSFSATGNLAALIGITVDGGAANDTILGSNGIDLLLGGDGNDFIDGQQGNDVAFMGAGDDVFQWDPGDGSDIVEGQDGTDTLLFNGSNIGEIFEVSANGGRALFTRNVANIAMDLNGVETIELNALGGVDILTVNDLSGTDVKNVNVNLLAGGVGDAQPDTVTVRATNGNDTQITVVGAGTSAAVTGLAAQVSISGAEAANDTLVIEGLGGNDTINASTLPAGVIKLTIDGGAGDDTIFGSAGVDTLIGGDGNDTIDGNQGNDVAFMGAGNDTFVWNPGDGNDTVEGQDGTDTLDFNGANIGENIDIVANGARVLFLRNVANVTMDLDGVEVIDFDALGGADNIVVGDLSGTAATRVNIDLAGPVGGGDGSADTVTVNATAGDDAQIKVTSDAVGTMTVNGLPAQVVIENGEAANDRLTVNGQGGNDTIDGSGVAAGQMKLTLNGGLGVDTLIGGAGDDLVNGGDGNDVALMGGGNDTFVWNPGDDNDTVEGQGGTDTLLFNGANIAEQIDIAANGGRVRFFRDIANVTMDLNGVETIDFKARGGADTIRVNDLSGTGVETVNLDLSAAADGGGVGDAAADMVVIQGTSGNDTISLSLDASGRLVVSGLPYQVVINGFEIGDTIQINGLAGDDVIDASALGAIGATLSFDGGDGNDILIGGAGNDVLIGGAGNDALIGNAGTDVMDGGTGDNVVLQDGPAAAGGVVALFGNDNINNITVSRNAAGAILANGGAIVLQGSPTVANTSVIQVFGKGGDDTLTLSEINGALPRADLFGGAGNDTATGGSGGDMLFGEAGNDTLLGKGGFDFLFGGDGNDTLTGGDADDQVFGEAGNDRMIWNPGDDTDLFEGGAGTDTAEVNGGNGAEVFTATANGTRVRFDRLDPAPFALDIGTTEDLVVNMNGGDDSFSATGNLAALIKITVDGGAGNDTILGSNGNDTLLGGDGNDFIDGNQGVDVAFLGAGDDVFQWDPGDGNDTVEGQDGTDTLLFNGSNIGEIFEVSANGGRALFTRNIANIVMDLNDTETIQLNALGGADALTVNDLSGTDVKTVAVNLQAVGGVGDAQPDTVTVRGTNGNDTQITVVGSSTVTVTGLAAQVVIGGAEAANDTLVIEALGGNDTINASTLSAGVIKLTVDGGAGNDTIIGSAGNDVLRGGADNDTLIGGGGNDTLDGGTGTDTVNYASATQTVVVDLPGHIALGAQIGTDTLSNIENVITGSGNDAVAGDGSINVLDGGAGIDTVSYYAVSGGVVIDLSAQVGVDGTSVDTLLNFENANGTAFSDAIAGTGAANVLDGLGGIDTVSYYSAAQGVVIDLAGNTAVQNGIVDTILNFENANGSAFNDIISGNAGTNVLNGLGGIDTVSYSSAAQAVLIDLAGNAAVQGGVVDTILDFENANGSAFNDAIASNSGANVLNGLGGTDTVSYYASAQGVTINLAAGTGISGGVADTLLNFENANGSAFVDTIIGNAGANILDGLGGADALTGGAGNDIFSFTAGQASGDAVMDFAGNGVAAGDALRFVGFGTTAQGAALTQLNATQWQIHSGIDGHNEIITLANGALIHASDFFFV